jgi:hypothetical protein
VQSGRKVHRRQACGKEDGKEIHILALMVGRTQQLKNKSYSPLQPGVIQYEEDLWEMRGGGYEEWRVNTVFYTGLKPKPHLACALIEGIIPDNRIRRAELLGILRLMKSAMKQAVGSKTKKGHMIYPVSLTLWNQESLC